MIFVPLAGPCHVNVHGNWDGCCRDIFRRILVLHNYVKLSVLRCQCCPAYILPSSSSLVFSHSCLSFFSLFLLPYSPKSRRYTFLAGIMASYNAIDSHSPSPYGSGDPYYNASTGYISPATPKKPVNKWIKIGIPIGILVIAGAVVAGVLASRHHSHNSSSSNSSSGSPAAASSALSAKNAVGIFPTGTDSEFMVPLYPSTVSFTTFEIYFRCLICSTLQTNAAAFSSPTFNPSNSGSGWPQDSFSPSNPSPTSLRPDRPRLIAPAYKWQALPNLIAKDAYLKSWNDTIFGNASTYYSLPPVQYFMDGSSGILDNARYVKQRLKAFSYAYLMSNDTKWADRAWVEIQVSH